MFVFNGFSDWEPALAIAGLQQFTDVEVNAFSVDRLPVRSMGNVQVVPDLSLSDLPKTEIALLLLLVVERGMKIRTRRFFRW